MNAPITAAATTLYSLPRSGAGEAPAPYSVQLDEATLASLWAGQRFPDSALSLPDGQRLRVLHPGRRNSPGPDFRDAVIIAGGTKLVRRRRDSPVRRGLVGAWARA